MECGRKFRTVEAAERAYFGSSGCPTCGGHDIDEDDTDNTDEPKSMDDTILEGMRTSSLKDPLGEKFAKEFNGFLNKGE
jgi:hypothetical protein